MALPGALCPVALTGGALNGAGATCDHTVALKWTCVMLKLHLWHMALPIVRQSLKTGCAEGVLLAWACCLHRSATGSSLSKSHIHAKLQLRVS